jgi:hypothetical protein
MALLHYDELAQSSAACASALTRFERRISFVTPELFINNRGNPQFLTFNLLMTTSWQHGNREGNMELCGLGALLPFTCLGRLSQSIIAQKTGDGTIQTVGWISLVRSFISCTRQRMGGLCAFSCSRSWLGWLSDFAKSRRREIPRWCAGRLSRGPTFALCRPCSTRPGY